MLESRPNRAEMSIMNQKALRTLEYDKIIEKLTEYAASEPAKALCRELLPSSDYQEIVKNQAETAVSTWLFAMDSNENIWFSLLVLTMWCIGGSRDGNYVRN